MPRPRGALAVGAQWKFRVASIAVGLLVGFGLFEAGMRGLGISFPEWFAPHPIYGRALRPGAEGWWTQEGRSYVRITADGRRDHERPAAKPPGTFRIAVLGDSYAAAFEVPQERAFWAVIERRMANCPALGGARPEVINFGVGGYGTASQFLVLKHQVWSYQPDLVLLAFLTGNDLSDNVRELKGSGNSAYFELHDGKLVLEEKFVRKRERIASEWRFADWWIEWSRVAQALARAKRKLKHALGGHEASAPGEPMTLREGLYDGMFMAPDRSVWQRAWTVTEALLVAIRDDVRDHGARFALVDLTVAVQVEPDPEARGRYAAAVAQPDLLYPDRRLAAFAARERMPFLMLVPPLLEWAEANQTCVHGFPDTPCRGHWNEHGHRLAGEEIATWLCREVLAKRRDVAG